MSFFRLWKRFGYGAVRSLLLESPADRARLRPGMKILGVNGRTWSGPRLIEAIEKESPVGPMLTSGFLTLLLALGLVGFMRWKFSGYGEEDE